MQRLAFAVAVVLVLIAAPALAGSGPGLLASGLRLAADQATPPPILFNPDGVISFDSVDHDKAVSYQVGWFRTEDQAVPDVAETVLVTNVTTNASAPTYTLQARTRPPFRRYLLRVKLVALATSCDADLGPCESSWSPTATWTKDGASGTWLGYTPRNATGVVLH
ncbi:MAG: hypothetical protein KBA95_01790 [Acidobacteria bacterium]|nr:hypothetical protein [Acidobacteriota bacterium]